MKKVTFKNLSLKAGIYNITVRFISDKETTKALILNIVTSNSEKIKEINLLKSSNKYQCFEYISSTKGGNLFNKTINFLALDEKTVGIEIFSWEVEPTDVTIEVEFLTALNRYFSETKNLVDENKRLVRLEKEYRRQISNQISKNEKLKNTLSYKIGNFLVTEPKTPRFYATLIIQIYKIYKEFKKREIFSTLCSIDEVKPIIVKTKNLKQLKIDFKLIASTSEIKNDALLKFEIPNVSASKALARKLGLSCSDSIGLYKYINQNQSSISINLPNNIEQITVTPISWHTTRDIYFAFCSDAASATKTIDSHVAKETTSISRFEKQIIDAKELPYDLQLKTITEALYNSEDSKLIAKYLKVLVDLGAISEASSFLSKVKNTDRLKFRRQVNSTIGYDNLSRRLPSIPQKKSNYISERSNTIVLVAHCALPVHSNGYATRTHEVAKELKRNYNVIVITRAGYPCDVIKDSEFKSTIIDDIEYRSIPGAHYYDDPLDQYIENSANAITQELSKILPKVVIGASAFYTSLPALIASRKLGIPFIYEIRGLWEITRSSSFPGWGSSERFDLEAKLEAYTATNADHIFAITQAVKDKMISRGVNGDKISLAPNAIRKEKFLDLPDVNLNYQPEKNIPVIGYVGSVVDYEGLDDLLSALETLFARGIKFQLVIAGDGAALESLKKQAENSSISHLVTFLGRIPHESVGKLMGHIDITPFPRKPIEVCELVSPLKPFESMILSKAIIASNVNALAEIVNGENGLTFEKGSIEDLAAKLEKLLLNKDLRESLGKTAYQWVIQNRLWSNVGKTYVETIENCNTSNIATYNTNARILIYGDVDLNYIDGSSVWAVSLTELFSKCKCTEVDILLKADDYNSSVIQQIKNKYSKVIIHRPSDFGIAGRLSPESATDILKKLVSTRDYDGLIIRGQKVLREVDKHPEFAGIIWSYPVDIMQNHDEEISCLDKAIIRRSAKVLCQSEFIKNRLINVFGVPIDRIIDTPPMVPDSENHYLNRKEYFSSTFRIVYAGKFDKLWATEEMLNCFIRLRTKNKNVELHVYGDKFNTTDPSFKERVEALLKADGIYWHQGVPRETVLNSLHDYDLAWGWRSKELEETTHEISTKFLEAASKGLPIICYDGPVFKSILGEHYPLKAKTEDDVEKIIIKHINNKSELRGNSHLVYESVGKYFYSKIIDSSLQPIIDTIVKNKKNQSILIAGHDLKFVKKFIENFRKDGYSIYIDKWQSHNKHEQALSKTLLSKADHVFCEWALGNAVWYSKNLLRHQKLTIRFHRQEIETEYPNNINMDNVENFLFIAPHVMRAARKKFWHNKSVGTVLENYVDCENLNRPKSESSKYTLGIVGVVPRMKRLDKALDILEKLNKASPKYTLKVKGKLAKDYPWMLSRPEEMDYYNKIESRIKNSPFLRESVIFDGHGNDMEDWFKEVGYLLSVSDFEGCHLSAMEAMAAGTIPLIHEWHGASEIYPDKNIFSSIEGICEHIVTHEGDIESSIKDSIIYARRWSIPSIYNSLENII